MNPKTAAKWIEADQYCRTHPVPSILAQAAAAKAKVAMRKAIPAKPVIRLPRGKSAKPKLTPLSKLKKELDRVFSIYTRTKDADENGIVTCVTCGRQDHWKNMDAGHYVPRQDMAVRWDPRNVWPQCRPDNAFRGGEPEKMAAYIEEVCGKGVSKQLRTLAAFKFKPSRQWMEEKIAYYKKVTAEGPALGPEQ